MVVCPITEELWRLEARAKKGDIRAARRLKEISKIIQGINSRLPPKLTQKPKKPSTPSNALALRLLEAVLSIKNRPGKGCYALAIEIKELKPLDKSTFARWWNCAWRIAEDDELRDKEMDDLINQIGETAPSVQEKFSKRKSEGMQIYQSAIGKKDLGIELDNLSCAVRKKIAKRFSVGINEWLRYVKPKTRLAAERIWFARLG
jgi:hypothetical protein